MPKPVLLPPPGFDDLSVDENPPRFIVRPLAEADLEDAARWYEDERAGLAE